MHRACGIVEGADDVAVTVVRVAPPDAEYETVVRAATPEAWPGRSDRHNAAWREFKRAMLRGSLRGMIVSVYLGYVGSEHVSTVHLFEGDYAAVAEYVWVATRFRGRGIASGIVGLAARNFAARGGEFVSAGAAPTDAAAVGAFRHAGFRPGRLVDPRCVWLTRLLKADFEAERVGRIRDAACWPYRTGDGPKVHALSWVLGGPAFGCAYEDLFLNVEMTGEGEARVLVSSDGTVVGFHCDRGLTGQESEEVLILHPACADHEPRLRASP